MAILALASPPAARLLAAALAAALARPAGGVQKQQRPSLAAVEAAARGRHAPAAAEPADGRLADGGDDAQGGLGGESVLLEVETAVIEPDGTSHTVGGDGAASRVAPEGVAVGAVGASRPWHADVGGAPSWLRSAAELAQRPEGSLLSALNELQRRSANQTDSFVRQVALQSAGLEQAMRELEQRSAGQGASHAFPHRHVARRRPRAGGDEDASADAARASALQAEAGPLALVLAAAGVGMIFSSKHRGRRRGSVAVVATKEGAAGSDHDFGGAAADLSVWDATVTTFSTIIGSGLLVMPYALSQAGLVAIPVIVFFTACSAYSAHLMAWALGAAAPEAERRGVRADRRGWGFLVEVAFGPGARRAIDAFLIVELWSYLLSCMVCMAMNVEQLVDGLSASSAVAASATLGLALTFVPSRLLTSFNVASNAVFVVVMVMFIMTGLLLPSKAPASDIEVVRPGGMVAAFGMIVFSPAAHSFYPAVMQRMKEPERYPVCLRRAYLVACVLYLGCAVPGYLLFGKALQPSAVANIGYDLHLVPIPNLGWMNGVAALCMAMKMLAMQPLVLTPLSSTVEGVLSGKVADSILAVSIMPCLLAMTAVVAVRFANDTATLLNLIGSVFCMNIAFVVPVVCYWKLATEPICITRKLGLVGLIAMGLSCAVLGVLAS